MKPITYLTVAAILFAAPIAAKASGCYCAKPPKPVAQSSRSLDAERYNLGKRVFAGKVKAGVADEQTAAGQRARLATLEARLPESARKRANLQGLAGRLTAEQLEALEYYVNSRYQK